MRKHLVALFVGAALSMGSSSAWALAYTLAAPVAFNNATLGISGTLNPVTLGAPRSACPHLHERGRPGLAARLGALNGGSAAVDRIDMSAAGVATVVGLGTSAIRARRPPPPAPFRARASPGSTTGIHS